MKTIQLSEREFSMIFSMLTPPYAVRDTHTDEFNELRNKVFYALRDAQNDEPVSNRDELPLDYLQGHKDGLELAAQLAEANHPQTGDWLYDDPTELAKAIRKGPDMPELKSVPADADDNFYSWFGRFWSENYQQNNYTTSAKQMLGTMAEFAFRAGRESATQAGNSPVIPDCWCHTCRPVMMGDMRFVVCPECGNKRCPHANDHRNACTGSNEPGQVDSAYPAAPQQEE
ncbi:hypothetical protein OGY62_10855 [Citrobacter sp. CK198]|uniref:hypothetical protein n=1 Tax=Citrobacter sp. CK198 TaxID=2985107 RepID=UPI002577FF09|nr:hypothetical protein [Citrobacter sp. CK198]MDM2973278.1 hypothetical protein [Citrobacter sp. CK198]